MGGGVYWEGVGFGYGASGRGDRRRGCGKIGEAGQGVEQGMRNGYGWAPPGSESLRSGQKNGLDLCMSNNFISMGGIGGGRNRTNCGTMLYA